METPTPERFTPVSTDTVSETVEAVETVADVTAEEIAADRAHIEDAVALVAEARDAQATGSIAELLEALGHLSGARTLRQWEDGVDQDEVLTLLTQLATDLGERDTFIEARAKVVKATNRNMADIARQLRELSGWVSGATLPANASLVLHEKLNTLMVTVANARKSLR